MVPSALQRRWRHGALSRAPSADAVPRSRRKDRRPRQGPDRIPAGGSVYPEKIRGRTGQARHQERDAGRVLQQSGLRMVEGNGQAITARAAKKLSKESPLQPERGFLFMKELK